MKDLGNRIRFERKAPGLTLQNFADLFGNSSSMLQRVETGASITPPTQKGYIWEYVLKGEGVFEVSP